MPHFNAVCRYLFLFCLARLWVELDSPYACNGSLFTSLSFLDYLSITHHYVRTVFMSAMNQRGLPWLHRY